MSTRSLPRGSTARLTPAGSVGPRAAAQSPWPMQAYVVYGVLAVVGAALFLTGTGMVATEKIYDDQVPGMNVAIAGVVVANAAGALLLVAGRRAVTARRVRVLGALPAVEVAAPAATLTAPSSSTALVAGEGLVHFHRADCALASGRNWPAGERAVHERAGRRACGVCKP